MPNISLFISRFRESMERIADAAKVGLILVSDDVDKMRAINAYRPGKGLEIGTGPRNRDGA